jgi:hypothetical protein
MSLIDHPWILFAVLLVGLLVVVEVAYRLALRASANDDEEQHHQIVAARDGIAVLLSLLLGFTLPMAEPHYELRKRLVVEEANAIGTTTLRARTLPEPVRGKILELLHQYLEARIAFAEAGLQRQQLQSSLVNAKELQEEIWQRSLAVAQQSPTPITSIFLQSLNEMIDVSEKRMAALEDRVPPAMWLMLILISLLTCFLAGYSMRRRSFLIMLVSPLMIAVVLSLIADLDSPRAGLIQVSQQSMQRLRLDWNATPPTP